MNITAQMVKTLREKTDAPMMECKKALIEAQADMERAEEILRIRLGVKAGKSSSRVAAEGAVGLFLDDVSQTACLLEINSETDFVAKNPEFIDFVNQVAEAVLAADVKEVDDIAALPLSAATVEEARVALSGKMGENLKIRRFEKINAVGKLAAYVHAGAKIGVLVDISGANEDLAKDIAMHIAAAKPLVIDESSISKEALDAEHRVAIEKAKEANKPESIIEKIADGAVKKFINEVTLLGQVFVKAEDGKQTVRSLLSSKSAKINRFVCFVVGEGLEKRQDDFAAEVAAQAASAKK